MNNIFCNSCKDNSNFKVLSFKIKSTSESFTRCVDKTVLEILECQTYSVENAESVNTNMCYKCEDGKQLRSYNLPGGSAPYTTCEESST